MFLRSALRRLPGRARRRALSGLRRLEDEVAAEGAFQQQAPGAAVVARGAAAFVAVYGWLSLLEYAPFRSWWFGSQRDDMEKQVNNKGGVQSLALLGVLPVAHADLTGGILSEGLVPPLRETLRRAAKASVGDGGGGGGGGGGEESDLAALELLLNVYGGLARRAVPEEARQLAEVDLPLWTRALRPAGADGRLVRTRALANRLGTFAAGLARRGALDGAGSADDVRRVVGTLSRVMLSAPPGRDCRGASEAVLELARGREGARALLRDRLMLSAIRSRSKGSSSPWTFEERRNLCEAARLLRERVAEDPLTAGDSGMARQAAMHGLSGVPDPPGFGSGGDPASSVALALAPGVLPVAALCGAVGNVAWYRAVVRQRVEARLMPRPSGLVVPPPRVLALGTAHMTLSAAVCLGAWQQARAVARETPRDRVSARTKLYAAALAGAARATTGMAGARAAVPVVGLTLGLFNGGRGADLLDEFGGAAADVFRRG